MAKRRRLMAPDKERLAELEQGFAAKPAPETKSMAPIAQVAGDTAAIAGQVDAQDRNDAAELRAARAGGLLVETIAIDLIDSNYISRDRVQINAEEQSELVASLRANGQRSPIEVVKTDKGYGLISGFRRLRAISEIGQDRIKAFVRAGQGADTAYRDMIEENEIRSALTHYERGRIVSVAVGQGVYANVDVAVDALFATASKAKRSKIRSFIAVHDGLGDLLRFPTALTEKHGLAVAKALANGQTQKLRNMLADLDPPNAQTEITALLNGITQVDKISAKGGRPVKKQHIADIPLNNGGKINVSVGGDGAEFIVKGRSITPDLAEKIARQIRQSLI